MLRIFEQSRLHRRQLLTLGCAAGGYLAWPEWARAAALPRHLTGKSVIFVFQQGGPSQFETFDPKVDAPESVRTITDTVATRLPGIYFGETMPRLAGLADHLTVVRSFQTNNAGHNIQPLVGPDSLETQIGVHYARVAGATRADTGMPTGTILYPRSVDPSVPKPEARGNLAATGNYPSAYAPFVPGSGGQLQQDMELSLPRDRVFDDRRALLNELDRLRRDWDASGELGAVDELRDQAYQLLSGGGIAQALDLSREDARVVARYDTSSFVRIGAWNQVSRGTRGYYDAQAATIGKLLLTARRLCEAGCGFVTVHAGYAGVWDMHADGNNLNMRDGMEAVGRSFDHALAAFIEDTRARGLQDKILLVACGEMGRTPRINPRGGRDHWAKLAPLLLYGADTPAGHVLGQSTRDGGEPLSEPRTPKHLIATILRTQLDVGQLRLVPGIPPEIVQLAQSPPLW